MEKLNWEFKQTEFSKSLLAGVFAGIAATVLSLFYNFGFRFYTGFSLSVIVNVTTIIFVVLLGASLAGGVFYLLHHYVKKGTAVYIFSSFFITLVLLAVAQLAHRSVNPVVALQFNELLSGIIIITGICIVFMIPFLFKRDYL